MTTMSMKIKNKGDAYEAWDKSSVIVRELDGYVYVYPMITRGYNYYGFNLREECNLMGFSEIEQAKLWANSKGYEVTVIR
jgi:hypothetical protein